MPAASFQSRSSRSARPSLVKKLSQSIFSELGSFMDESLRSEDGHGPINQEKEKQRFAKLLDELESYEEQLAEERAVLDLEREALEFELKKQANKNQELETIIKDLKAENKELKSALQSQKDDQMLLVENEILRKRLKQREEAMMSMPPLLNATRGEEDPIVAHTGGDGIEMPSAKLQGDLLQTPAKLTEKDRIIQAQAEEIKSLRKDYRISSTL